MENKYKIIVNYIQDLSIEIPSPESLITIRNSTERPETIKIGCNILSKINDKKLYNDTLKLLNRKINWRNPYGDGKAAEKSYYIIKKFMKKNDSKYY